MSFPVYLNIDLVFHWSITENGELCVELCPKNNPNEAKAEFTFDTATIVSALDSDLESDNVDYEEWTDLINYLNNTATILQTRLKDHLNEHN